MSIRPFYDRWPQYNRRLTEIVRAMTAEQLAIRPSPDGWPIWATVGHNAGGRAYWLFSVLKEPGAEKTPFADPLAAPGWEDDLDHPRTAAELVGALDATWAILDGCLDRWTPEMLSWTIERVLDTWTPEMLGEEIERWYGETRQIHSRASILQRLLTHDAYHCGELSQTLGIAGLPQIDLWRPD